MQLRSEIDGSRIMRDARGPANALKLEKTNATNTTIIDSHHTKFG